MEKLLTVTQAAALIGLSEARLRQIIAANLIAVKRVGKNERYVRVRESEALRYKKARQITEEIAA